MNNHVHKTIELKPATLTQEEKKKGRQQGRSYYKRFQSKQSRDKVEVVIEVR